MTLTNIANYFDNWKTFIVSKNTPFNKLRVSVTYFRLIISAFLQKHSQQATIKEERILGMTIYFQTYSLLIDQFQEIFLKNVYYFKCDETVPKIVDAGSNIGLSIIYFKLLFPRAEILSFEPDEETFNLLQKTIKRNQMQTVNTFRAALCNREGITNLFKEKGVVGSLNMSIVPTAYSGSEEIEVPTTLLSNYINDEIHFAKIDTEGSEIAILENLIYSRRLKYIKEFVVEFHAAKSVLTLTDFCAILIKQKFDFVKLASRGQIPY